MLLNSKLGLPETEEERVVTPPPAVSEGLAVPTLSRSSALPIFSNMALALWNRVWWLSVREIPELSEAFF